ncbi:MAG: fimbrillin family protein [Prevotella sp.]
MFAACTSETEVQDVSPKDVISFNTTLKGVTKTVYTNETFDKFKVVALNSSTGDSYFTDDVVKVSASKWATTQIQKWPDYELSFFAYAPTDLNPTIDASSKVLTDFEPAKALANQQDIVTAFNTGTKANQNGVDLKFRHALTQIEILATNEDVLRYKVEVLGSKLVRVKSKATMTFPTDANSAASWSTATTPAQYGDKLPAAITLDATPQRVMTDGNNWMMLPQQLEAWNLKPTTSDNNQNNNGAYIAVLLRISDASGNPIYPDKDENAVAAKFAYAAIPVSTKWELGHKYTYTLKFFSSGGGAGFIADELTDSSNPTDSDIDAEPKDNWNATTMIGTAIIEGIINFNVTIEDWVDGTTTTETIEN